VKNCGARASSKTLLVALALCRCSIYDDMPGGFSGGASAQSGSGGKMGSDGSSGGFSGKGGNAPQGGSSGAAGAVDASGASGAGGMSGAGGTSVDGAAGQDGFSGAAGASNADGAAGGSGASGAAGSSSRDGSSGAGGSSAIDGADAVQPCVVGTGPARLPFAVDEYFVASGWMQPALIRQEASCFYPPTTDAGSRNDGPDEASADSAIAVDARTDGPSDGSTVPPLPGSKCWTITYAPASATDWAGVNWQYPMDNWGASPGLVIPPGATRVSLVAWGDAGIERVSFEVGYGPASTDGFRVSLTDQLLTTSPTHYAIDLGGVAYTCNSVRMGFGWLATGGTTMTFHVANIRWE
jgi:hypothetical protein